MIARKLSETDQSDCVQEVWKEVVAKLRDFEYDPNRCRLRTWLQTLARNKAVDVVRRRSRHPTENLSDEVVATLHSSDLDPVAAAYERRQLQSLVRGVLAELSQSVSVASYRVLYLRWVEGRTLPEIAEALGLTPEQVRFRHHRVKRKFRDLMVTAIGEDWSWEK